MVAENYAPPSRGDISAPGRYLLWLVRSQPGRIAAGAALGSSWMLSLALPPYVLSRAVDDGLVAGDTAALLMWTAVLLLVAITTAVLGISRHRTMTKVRMDASFRTIRATVRHSARLGATLSKRMSDGEVVAIGIGDVQVIALAMTVTGPGFGAVVAYAGIAIVMFDISTQLALVVLAGVPLLVVSVGPLLRRIERTGTGYREHQGRLTSRLVDVLSGLQVLNGLGGKQIHADRFREQSRRLTEEGYRAGSPVSWVGALANGLPALFLAVVIWLAARMAAQGEISVGDLVAVYGYVAVLVVPVSFFIEGGGDIARALVAARRVIGLLALEPEHRDTDGAGDVPEGCGPLVDPASGITVRSGLFSALVSAHPSDAIAVVERLGRFGPTGATWAGAPLRAIATERLRERLLVADNNADFFAGTVREVVAGRHLPDDDAIRTAVHAAMADDVVAALPDGLDSAVAPAASTLSGGQRQRLRMARALYAEPDVLLAVDPTSAVDAHTEAAMTARVKAARRGRTTLVTTTSPLVLDQADEVLLLLDGVAAASGTHDQLLRTVPAYREIVSRTTGRTSDDAARS